MFTARGGAVLTSGCLHPFIPGSHLLLTRWSGAIRRQPLLATA